MKYMHFKALSIGHQNEWILSDFLLGFKGAIFGEKYQFFQSPAVSIVQCKMNRF